MRSRSRSLARTLAIVVAVGAVVVTVAGIAGPPIVGLIAHPATQRDMPSAAPVPGRAYTGDPANEAALVRHESERTIDAQSAASAAAGRKVDVTRSFRVLTDGRPTLVLPGRATPYSMGELAAGAPDSVRDAGGGALDVVEHVLVSRGATLQLQPGQTVRLASDASGFTSITVAGGTLTGTGTADARIVIESWDAAAGAVDSATADGRAYVRGNGGAIQLANADVTALGFWSGPTGGLAATAGTGSSSALNQIGSSSAGTPSVSIAPTGGATAALSLDGVTVDGNAYGVYVDSLAGASITGSTVKNSLVDGIYLKTATDAKITSTTVSGNAIDGLVAADASSRLAVSKLTAQKNARNGVTIDGRAAEDGPNPSGDSVKGAVQAATISASKIIDNARYGVDILGGSRTTVAESTISGGLMGVTIRDGAASTSVEKSAISGQRQHAIAVLDDTRGGELTGNRIDDASIGIYVRNAGAVVRENRITDAPVDAIALVGTLAGTRVTDNTISGTGAGAIDTDRAIDPRVENNLIDGWVASQSLNRVIAGIFSPLTVIWSAVLALVAFAVIYRLGAPERRRQHAPLQQFSRGVFTREAAGSLKS
ncbi:right-handed parallel beta-helix repeat-containing protein [Schumannella sp. 10F1B-5-1]|uniref:right-handed parallel beta-helix repeat-containing protein n=1 Tax=Schumannella sp. 10F1B-5-1 TaxID=2590780 RepID=UPI00113234B7|nr:right-handed parallel beta-helix repeat-containing protein [Schumannella sp. 10F1B-5-1]TPW76702.1 right-handed parallel beta-helix repeat-containing protein [Schumannella sp. 10F1B-5-1]